MGGLLSPPRHGGIPFSGIFLVAFFFCFASGHFSSTRHDDDADTHPRNDNARGGHAYNNNCRDGLTVTKSKSIRRDRRTLREKGENATFFWAKS